MALSRFAIGVALAGVGALAFASHGKESPLAFSSEKARAALRKACGNVTVAARDLGVAEKTLHAVMNRHPELRRLASMLRRKNSRTGHGRPPRNASCSR